MRLPLLKSHRVWLGLFVLGLSALIITLAAKPATAPRTTVALSCSVSDKLVNPCRPWLGAFADGYPGVSGLVAGIADHETRIGRKVDVVRQFYPFGSKPLNNEARTLMGSGHIIFANYRPATPWINAAGSNATVNAQIDQAADSIKASAPTKIMLSLEAEPEDNVSSGVTCTTLNSPPQATSGSPADYVAMWRNVRNRFNARGVTNVVWVMNYMGYSRWNCMIKDLWPGNDIVDWVMWDPYVQNNSTTFTGLTLPFYQLLSNQSDAAHAFTSKPWGIAEWGVGTAANQATAYRFYADARTTLTSSSYSRLKLYSIFDAINPTDFRILYDINGNRDDAEQTSYRAFANDAAFNRTSTPNPVPPPSPPPTTPVPTPTPTPVPPPSPSTTPNATPQHNSSPSPPPPIQNQVQIKNSDISVEGSAAGTSSGSVVVQAPVTKVSDVTKVEYRINGKLVATVTKAPFTTALDTSHLPNGDNYLETRIYNDKGLVRTDKAVLFVDNRKGLSKLIPIKTRDRAILSVLLGFMSVVITLLVVLWVTGRRTVFIKVGSLLSVVSRRFHKTTTPTIK